MSNIKDVAQKAKILFKIDSVENWNIIEDSFQTSPGELYFYENARDTGRINHAGQKIFKPSLKIGNGASLKNLTFWGENYITTKQIDEIFSSIKQSGVLGLNTLSAFYLGRANSASIDDPLKEEALDEFILC